MTHKRWVVREPVNQSAVQRLCDELHIDAVLAALLVQRGIADYDTAKHFFCPEYSQLHEPFMMTDMRRAVNRINCAVGNKERIMIYGDYDVDGTTAVALVYSFFKKHYDKDRLAYYIPDRYNEGYGLSKQGIDRAYELGCKLIICLDCGIKAVERIEYASQKGLDVIVCDHHTPGDTIPNAIAVLNPKRSDCTYHYKDLSGCGVGFKLVQAYAKDNKIAPEEVMAFIDLVAVSIASDVVPMDGENRTLAYLGMKKFNENPLPGLKMLQQVSGMNQNQEHHLEDIVFKIGPRINAAGRMKSGIHAVEALISEDTAAARNIAAEIDAFNKERRKVDEETTQAALCRLAESPSEEFRKTTVIFDENWHKGIVGIVASRLIEHYYRPTIVMTKSNDKVSGSARSVEGFDLYSAIESCSDLLVNFGGHTFAAGLSLELENVEAFRERFEQAVEQTITKEMLTPTITIDAEMPLENITDKFVRILRRFKPFGPKNSAPIFMTRGLRVFNSSAKKIGQSKEHLRFEVSADGINPIPCVAFQMSEKLTREGISYYNLVHDGELFDICYSVDENTFRGLTTIQLMIKDIRPHNP